MNELDFINAFNRPWQSDIGASELFAKSTRPAAVLICMFRLDSELHVLFTERAKHLKHHAGQISFPGGKSEKTDSDLVDTAYREAEEEIGLDRTKLRLLGRLGKYRTISGFAVTPIVSIFDAPLNIDEHLVIDENEVANVFHVPLAFLMDRQNYYKEIFQSKSKSFPVYFIPYRNRMIWGATAGMLALLQEHIETHR